jgi:hypothetical protein
MEMEIGIMPDHFCSSLSSFSSSSSSPVSSIILLLYARAQKAHGTAQAFRAHFSIKMSFLRYEFIVVVVVVVVRRITGQTKVFG